MGEMKVKISDKVERAFRKLAMQRYGYQKGAISEAAENAFGEWVFLSEVEPIEDPIEAISGLMKHVKKNSVELQHEVGKILAKKYVNRC